MTTYKVAGEVKDGRQFKFFVECESANLAVSVILEKLVTLKLSPMDYFVEEATQAEIEEAVHVLSVTQRVGA